MSGTNPFRRKPTAEQSSSALPRPLDHIPLSSAPGSGVPPIDTDVAPHVKVKTSKTVRIISPHSAEQHDPIPDEFYNTPRAVPFSPPPDLPTPNSVDETSPEDPFAAGSEGAGSGTEDEGTRLNTQANAGESLDLRQANSGMPLNPFKKTLASLEEQKSPGFAQPVFEQSSAGSNIPPVKPQYDVNEFKRLLLTGDKGASKPNPASAPTVIFGQPPGGDSSSNTDASSVSRQSIFEPIATVHHESPRSSQENSDIEKQSLGMASELKTTKSKPSAPKHRHGKLVPTSGPQTVSFEDPSLSTRRLDGARPRAESRDDLTSSDSFGDKHKASPSLPSSPVSTSFGSRGYGAHIEPTAEPKDLQANLIQQKKPAPAPPPTRRSRPMSISSINSGRSVPLSEEVTAEPMQMSSSPSNRPPNAPAPPPPRRSKSFRGDSSVSTPTFSSVDGGSQQSVPTDQSPPPSQKPSTPVPSKQSPSILASRGPNRTSPASMSPAMAPPPPPPPRRRGSSQSSNNYTPSRLSGTYSMPNTERHRSDSGASSISQLPMKTIPVNSENRLEQDDVMADLTALQREVDELRGKMK